MEISSPLAIAWKPVGCEIATWIEPVTLVEAGHPLPNALAVCSQARPERLRRSRAGQGRQAPCVFEVLTAIGERGRRSAATVHLAAGPLGRPGCSAVR